MMLRNYFTVAYRNLLRNKGFSIINILGLAIGIATCLVISLFVYHEMSFDSYNKNADRMVRVYFQGNVQGEKLKESTVMPPVAAATKRDFPEVEDATRLRDFGKPGLTSGDKSFNEDAFAYVDPNFFRLFTLPLVKGDVATALELPNSVVITRVLAQKYFGKADAMGKTISFKSGSNVSLTVTGIIEEVPTNSHFQFALFASMNGLAEAKETTWMSSNFYTYLLLKKGVAVAQLEAKLPTLVERYIGPQLSAGMGLTLAEFKKKGNDLGFHLQPLTSIHLGVEFANDLSSTGDKRYVQIFGAIGLFMLLIACINFMNLSTAGATKRAREVGVRKVLGSGKKELIMQFLSESILVAFLALLLSLLLVFLCLPLFNDIAGKQLQFSFLDYYLVIPGLLAAVLLVGALAGSYPAFYLSSFKPVSVLKGKAAAVRGTGNIRSGLVVIQFFISILLITCTAIVFQQLNFIRDKKLGYVKDEVMVIQNTWVLGSKQDAFYQQLVNDARVAAISRSGYLPAGPSNANNYFVYPGSQSNQLVKTIRYDVDEKYLDVLGLQLKSGRYFAAGSGLDSTAVVINEAAAKALGWGENAVGQMLSTNAKGKTMSFPVIGVVKDFHFKNLHQLISPMVMSFSPDHGTLIVKLKKGNPGALLASLPKWWNALGANEPITWSFLDERFRKTHHEDQQIGLVLGIFSGLTILVACMGLFGLAKFTALQKTKEIGIRKVLGASVANVSGMLSWKFIKLVLYSCLGAFPLAYWVMQQWLQDFAYRIEISWLGFLLSAFVAVLIAFFTVSYQSIKAAVANPVKSLRTE